MESIDAIKFTDYEKISDEIMYLCKDITLKFNVTLARKRTDGSRSFYHSEYTYESKYLDTPMGRTMRRSFGYYLSIDIKNDFDNSLLIYPKHMIYIQSRLKEAAKWFSTLYKKTRDKLVLSHDFVPIKIVLFNDKYLELTPIIIQYENGTMTQGIGMNFNGLAFGELNIDKFYEFLYFINTLNMHLLASTMIASLPIEPGTNTMIMGADGRTRTQSFFDKPPKE